MPQSPEAHKKYMREVWYPRNRKKHMLLTKKHKLKVIQETKEYLRKIKEELGCKDCGIKDYRVLDFDHVKGTKILNLAQALNRGWSLTKIKLEIEKCEVRCANCHRIITWQRRNNTAD